MPKVKICGLSRPQDIEAVNAAGADYAGFVFFEKSKRNISFAQAEALLALLNSEIQSVAVCVSPDLALVEKVRDMGFDIIQIHGAVPDGIEHMLNSDDKVDAGNCDVTLEYREDIRDKKRIGTAHGDGGLALWRAVNIGGVMDLETEFAETGDTEAGGSCFEQTVENDSVERNVLGRQKAEYALSKRMSEKNFITGYVVDGANYGGGKTFGWEDDANFDVSVVETLHKKLNGKTFVLAGGLNVENVRKGIGIFRPDVVDVSSGVETDGVKDAELIFQFVHAAKFC